MKKSLLFTLCIFFLCKIGNANNYSLLHLSDSLKKNDNAIIWKYDIDIIINKDLSFTQKVHKVITILNAPAIEQAIYYGYESKEMSSHLNKGIIYDENGNSIKKIKKSDINTIGEYSQFISDFRADYYNPELLKFPYTVEYEYETQYNYLLYLPEFNPYQNYNTSIVSSTYKIQMPENCSIRYYNQNNTWQPVTETKNNLTTYTFEIKNKPAIKEETNAPDFDKIVPKVIIAPNQISYYGYKEKFEKWSDFGKWIIQLNNNRDSLPVVIKEQMHQYKSTYTNKIERAKAIYKWMQDNTRYYSIQLGLGGFQPMKTLDVNKNKYGDCKALSFYTKTLFKEAGIDAYYTLVNAGKNKGIIKEFPANQFNHVIVCLPLDKDTIWLECTDQKIPFGFLGDFTDDRDVLVINDNPSIVHTKCYSVNDNVRTISAKILLNEDKTANGQLIYNVTGLQSEILYKADYLPSKELQKKYLYDVLNVNNLEMRDYLIDFDKAIIPQKKLTSNFQINNYTTKIGNKIILEPNIFSKYKNEISSDTNRILPIEQRENYTEIDSIYFNLPKDYFTENNIKNEIETKFGNYLMETSFDKKNNSILFIRKLIINKGTFSSIELKEYLSFIKKIIASDNSKILLKKTTL